MVFCSLNCNFAAELISIEKNYVMKRVVLTVGIAFLFGSLYAQKTSEDYLVKTKGVKKTVVDASQTESEDEKGEEEKSKDFISENFKYYSMCDWQRGMRFMVMPEKYDMVVKTFHDKATGKEVSSMPLRHSIMVYQGHTVGADGRAHVNFLCQNNNKEYFYEIPNGSFEDHCYGKMGVPTLAYLGDVDIACEKLIGRGMFTKSDTYYQDTDNSSEGFIECKLAPNTPVKVTKVGVGTRNFPVKIIFEDEKGDEYFQNVAISKTNSGMRDDEFIMDKAKHLFGGSFQLEDILMTISRDLSSYIGKYVFTKYSTKMISKGAGKERELNVPRETTFTIENIAPKRNSQYVTLTLKDRDNRRIYFKDVTFTNTDNVAGDIDGRREDFFGYLFSMGEGKVRKTSQAARAAIRQGRVILGMSEDEVLMAVGEPERTVEGNNGYHEWIIARTGGKKLIVKFDGTGRVTGTSTTRPTTSKKTTTVKRKTTTKRK